MERCPETDLNFLKRTISDLTEEMDLLSMLQDMGKQLITRFDFDHIVRMCLDMIQEIIDYEACVLYLHREETDSFSVAAMRGFPEDVGGDDFVLDEKVLEWVLKEGRWAQASVLAAGEEDADRVASVLPLQGIKRTLGFLLMFSNPRTSVFTPANIKLLSFIASQAGVALENQDLYARLSRSKEYIHNILENINNGILTVDMKGRITHLNKNATAMLNLRSADVIGRECREILERPWAEVVEKEKQKALRDGFTLESLVEHPWGEDLAMPLGISTSLLRDHQGNRMGVIVVLRNMGTSRELERLRQLDALKSEFVSSVSHELRTPLSIIKSYVEALRDRVPESDHDTRREFLSTVDTETDRLSGLVNDLLDISRIESGRFDLEFRPVSLHEVVAEVIPMMENRSGKHTIDQRVAPDLPCILGDRDRLIQVFVNLIDNALKFSPDGGTVVVEACERDGRIVCTVSDEGIGIKEEDLDRIFDKFFRGDPSSRREISGTGLGLPIVKHIVESHEGTLSVESDPGRGSTFVFALPFEGGG